MNQENKVVVLGTRAEGIDRFCKLIKHFPHISDVISLHISDLRSLKREYVENNVKFVILLRNPALRSFELWKIMLCEGFEWVDDFEIALAREQTRFFGAEHRKLYANLFDFLYWRSSLYSEKILSFMQFLGRENFYRNVLCLVLDEFRNEGELVQTLQDFLACNPKSDIRFKLRELKISKEKIPYNSKVQYLVRVLLEEFKEKLGFEPKPLKALMILNIHFGKKMIYHWCVDFLKFTFRKELEKLSEILRKDLTKIWS